MTITSSMPIENGTLRYQIQVRQISDGTYQQRHVWLAGSESHGVVVAADYAEPWITASRSAGESFMARWLATWPLLGRC